MYLLLHACLGVRCGKPPDGNNLVPVPNGTDIEYGGKYFYSCITGTKPVSENMDMSIICGLNELFSPPDIPICVCKYCIYIKWSWW